MRGVSRNVVPIIAAGAIVLMLCGALCLFDDNGGGVDLCLLVLAIAGAALVMLTLEPAGHPVFRLASAAYPTPTEVRSPPPRW